MNEYLWEFAQTLPGDNQFQIVLKSALSISASIEAEVGKNNNKWMCRKCKTLWMHGYFHVDEIRGTTKYDNLLEKCKNRTPATRKQQKLQKYMMSRKGTTAKYTCKLCSYKTRVVLDKGHSAAPPVSLVEKDTNGSKNKRKHKRDPTAGLIIPSAKVNPKPVRQKNQAASTLNSKQPNQLHALANMLKKKSEGTSSAQSKDRLKLLLK